MNRSTVYNLYEPENSDYRDVSVLSSNFDTIDGVLDKVEDAIAIIANGNTHAAVKKEQFVYVRNHSSLAEGLYRAKSNISANSSLSSSNLDADSSGGLNALYNNTQKAYHKVGDTQTQYVMWGCYGHITTDGTNLQLCIPMAISPLVSSMSITLLKLRLRIPTGGYLVESDFDATSYIDNIALDQEQGLVKLRVLKSNGWSVPNNSIVIGEITWSFSLS